MPSAIQDNRNSEKRKVSAAEIAAAKARLFDVLAPVVRLKRKGNLYTGLCPFHREKTPSFTVYPEPPPHYHCFGCGSHGTAIDYVQRTRGLDFPGAVRELCGDGSPRTPRPLPSPRRLPEPCEGGSPRRGDRAAILDLWNSADDPRLVEFYLQSRGLDCRSLPAALRGHNAVWCKESGQHRPAVLAACAGLDGIITAIQRIWVYPHLDYAGATEFPKGARATDIAAPKKTWGSMGRGAVQLYPAGDTLGLAEGVETAIAARMLFKLPVWSTLGTGRLGKIALPECIDCVVSFADSGPAGEAAAEAARDAYEDQGLTAEIVYPAAPYGDFAEQVLACR